MSQMAPPIYLDYNGTTPMDPHVIEAMEPFLETEFGNPSPHADRSRDFWVAAPVKSYLQAAAPNPITMPLRELPVLIVQRETISSQAGLSTRQFWKYAAFWKVLDLKQPICRLMSRAL